MIITIEFVVTGKDAEEWLSAQLEEFVKEHKRITYFETMDAEEPELD